MRPVREAFNTEAFVEDIEQTLKTWKLTNAEFCKIAHFDRKTWYNLKARRVGLTLELACRIARTLDLSLDKYIREDPKWTEK